MTTTFERYGSLFARLALAAIFVHAGWGKLANLDGVAGYIGSKGLPAPLLLALAAGLVELLGGLALAVGLRARWAALALALFLVPTTFFFHNPIGLEAAAAQMQQIHLFKNLAIVGGLVAVASLGAGALALDVLFARPRRSPARPLEQGGVLS